MSEDLQPARTEPLKIGVLISGSGTNLQALIDAIDEGTLNAQIVIVISSKPEAKGLLRAQKAGIQTLSLNPGVYENARVANTLIAEELQRAGAAVSYTHLDVYKRQRFVLYMENTSSTMSFKAFSSRMNCVPSPGKRMRRFA